MADDTPLGNYDGIDYFSSPLATGPKPSERYTGIRRMIDIFGRSTIVAQFEQRLAADDGRPFTYNTYSGIRGLENSRHPDAQRALQELRDTETAIRANPETLANVPSASGREANHGLRGALVVAATRPLSPVSIPRDAKATYEV